MQVVSANSSVSSDSAYCGMGGCQVGASAVRAAGGRRIHRHTIGVYCSGHCNREQPAHILSAATRANHLRPLSLPHWWVSPTETAAVTPTPHEAVAIADGGVGGGLNIKVIMRLALGRNQFAERPGLSVEMVEGRVENPRWLSIAIVVVGFSCRDPQPPGLKPASHRCHDTAHGTRYTVHGTVQYPHSTRTVLPKWPTCNG